MSIRLPSLSSGALLATAAAAAPSLLAYNVAPSPTFLNQALALALWGWFVVAAAPPSGAAVRGGGALAAALVLVLGSVLWSWLPGSLPAGLALSATGLLLATLVLVASGLATHARPDAASLFADFCTGWAVAGVLNVAIALVQVFAPTWPDGDIVAISGIAGRAVGNLRQPNHLSSLLLWSIVAVVALAELRRIGTRWAAALVALMVFAVVLTASRTGALSVLLLAAWGVADRRLSRATRGLLLATPLLYAACWLGMAEWAKLSQHTFGGAARLDESMTGSSRMLIWLNALAMLRQQPWTGVGFGEFNFAWTLTPIPGRPVALFDHTHNLPLQLAIEIGLPLTLAVLALLGWALWSAARTALRGTGEMGLARRAACVMVVMIGLHSLLEYPLWYSYFLLPAAWAWAFALGRPEVAEGEDVAHAGGARSARPAAAVPMPSPVFIVAGVVLVASAVLAVWDYRSVAAVFSAAEGQPPLDERIRRGQRSLLFAHHADYAAATTELPNAEDDVQPFERATHYLLDTRLMMAWAKALDHHGETEKARYVAARLREFRNPGADEFFGLCSAAAAPAAAASSASSPASGSAAAAASPEPPPFQCAAPQQALAWRDFQQR